jgi:APA family basic amino acid/polyamine antiporter
VAIDAMPTVELGAAIPLSGGPYSLAARSIGPFTGFFVGWADWLQLVMSTGFISVAFGQYVQRLGIMADWSTAVVAILLLIGCGVLNWIGARVGGASQNIGSALKALVLVALVVTLFVAAKPEAAAPPPPPLFTWVAAAVALRAIYGAYGGWQAAVYFSEEVHQPERNIARATFAGIALVTALYVLVNAAVLHVVPVGILVNSTLAVSDAAAMVLGPGSGTIVTVLAIICVATIANLQVMEHVRTTYAMARKGMLPPGLATVSASGTPRAALVVVLVCIALVITGATFIKGGLYEVLLNLYAPNIMIIFLLLSYGALKLRRTEPDLPRPYKMPFYPLPALVSMVINGILLVLFLTTDLVTSIWSIIFLALAVPLYFLGRSRWRAA